MSTVIEVQAKEAGFRTEYDTALVAAKVLTPGTPEFDDAYGRVLTAKAGLAKIPEELVAARLSDNKSKIDAASVTLAESIHDMIVGLGVSDLLGKPVETLRYFRIESVKMIDGAEVKEVSSGVVFNPTTLIKPGKPVSTATESVPEKKTGRMQVGCPDGTKVSPTRFALQFADEAEKTKVTYAGKVTPHVLVDSKPKFDAFCVKHGVTGYTYGA